MEENQEIVEQPVTEVTVEDTSPTSMGDDGTIKLDMGKFAEPVVETPIEQPVEEQPVAEAPAEAPAEPVLETAVEDTILEEITEEEVVEQVEELAEQVEQAVVEASAGIELPENIQKVVDFMNETSGSLEDYVKLNQNYEDLDAEQLLKEYYADTKPHLDKEDIEFLMEDKFLYDEDMDEERDIKRKKLARREELAKARTHLTGLKDKYYEEIRGGARLAPEQKKAVEFFNRYTKENEAATQIAEKQANVFLNKTDKVFNDDFKGFDYQVGDKKYRFKVKDANSIKENQSDINNFVKKFLNEKNEMSDAKGYHKGLFTAMNADSIANHFYEQGKSDAMKTSMEKSKNVQMGARGVHQEVKSSNGFTVRSVDSGAADSKLRIKTFKHLK